MSAAKWTYGPSAGHHDYLVYDEATGRDVAIVRDFNEAHAQLVAAAPELLEASREYLRAVVNTYGQPPHLDRVADALKYAIALAQGGVL